MSHPHLPKFWFRLLQWFCREELFEELQGDLEEAFEENIESVGLQQARRIYRLEVLKLFRLSVIKKPAVVRVSQLPGNYITTSVRAMKHNPFYIAANILGMALALSIGTIGYFNYRFNDMFNEYFPQAAAIYKVNGLRTAESTVGTSPGALAPALHLAGIAAFRYHNESIAVKLASQSSEGSGHKLFMEGLSFTDPGFIRYFDLANLNNEPLPALGHGEVYVSDETAMKFFGDPYPVGKLLTVILPNHQEQLLTVKDVFRKLPNNTSFRLSILADFEHLSGFYGIDENSWSNWVDGTFVYAPEGDMTRVVSQMNSYLDVQNQANKDLQISGYRLDNILEWPALEASLHNSAFVPQMHPAAVAGTLGSAIGILLLACFNFINTSIALSGNRLKEIAVRKVLGGNRASTITQFILENFLMIGVAVVIALGLTYYMIPGYNAMMSYEIIQPDQIPWTTFIYFGLVLVLCVGLMASAYPALYISKFASLAIFRNKVVLSGKNRLMTVLLTFQFALCFYNIFGLLVTTDNAWYQERLDRGYDLGGVINIPLSDPQQYTLLEDRLKQHTDIRQIAGTSSLVGFSFNNSSIDFNGQEYEIAELGVGAGYLETLGIRLINGSLFSGNGTHTGEPRKEAVINSMLDDQLGGDALNKPIVVDGDRYTVIGVVEDFNLRQIMFNNKIKPCVMRLMSPQSYRYATLKADGLATDKNRELEALWYELFPQELYGGFLQEDVMQQVRQTNFIMINISMIVATISILISILGLYTLISLIAQKRKKEFGIRKVMGASWQQITQLLGRDIYWILGIAAIIGLAGGSAVMHSVLDGIYAYHVDISITHYVWPTMIILGIVVGAVGYKMMQTSKLNPVEQLRVE
ncbi:MAG: FtsX-like permease family protein [Imperialibacter sp.]|uniref:FtsX-like permease family protein n=1 Tax=Imperialibacter sp. TaxID=2038411 RepID=UPI003A890DA8